MAQSRSAKLELHRETLPNGLRLVLAPDRSAPVVAVSVHYDVGMRSEPEGRAGFAHLFEHLMFQGSENVEKLAHYRCVQAAGGVANGTTHFDYTAYYEVLPSAALERALFLEADRMRAPRITAENLRNQVDVVKQEIRLNVLNRPYGGFPWIPLPPVLYDTFPNAHNGYGDFTELEAATVDDCAAFFDAYYAPGNAVLTVVGDLNVAATLELVHRHFGDVPARPVPPRPSFAEPSPNSERRLSLPDPIAPLPAVALGYRLPDPAADIDGYLAHELLVSILTGSHSARLTQRLVHADGLVVDLNARCGFFAPLDARDPDTLTITAVLSTGVDVQRVVAVIDEEVARLAEEGPDPDEMARVTARWATALFYRHDLRTSRALDIGTFELLHGRAELVAELSAMVAAVRPEQLMKAAAELRPDSRALLLVEPAKDAPAVNHKVPTSGRTGGTILHRTAEEIGRTAAGPRALPPLGRQRTLSAPTALDTVLDNGLRVLAVKRSALPMAELRLIIPFGGTHRTHAARATLLAASFLSGTPRRDRLEIDSALAMAGGALSTEVGPEYLSVSGSVLASRLDVLLDVLGDVLTSASYADAEVIKERTRLVEQITMRRSQLQVIAREALQRSRYGDHPVTREIPEADEVAAVDRAALEALHRCSVVPRGAVLVVVGDVTTEYVVDAVGSALHGWRSENSASSLAPLPDLPGADLKLVDRPGAAQSHLRLSAQAVTHTDERYLAVELANLVFGGYFSSRWVANIREHKGYAYTARSALELTANQATLVAEADIACEATAATLQETRYELDRLTRVPPDESEVDNARNYAIGGLAVALSAQSNLADYLKKLTMAGLDFDWLRTQSARLQAVTAAQVAEAAQEFFAPTRFTGVVVGDAERLAGPLAALGGIELP